MRGFQTRTLKHVLHLWTKKFQTHRIPDPCSSAEYIIAHAVNRKTLHNVDLFQPLTEAQTRRVDDLCKMRLSRMPVQYILEEWDFLDLTLKMKPPVLIPRPETEELAMLCMDSLDKIPSTEGKVFLEIGPGSGAISIALLKKINKLQAIAVDISRAACELTRHNAELTGVSDRLVILEGDIRDEQVMEQLKSHSPFCLVVSNPPYISTAEMDVLQPEVACFEDHQALHGGLDGLDLVKEVMWRSAQLLQPSGHMWLEVGATHPRLVEAYAKDNLVWLDLDKRLTFVRSVADLYGKDRFCHLVAS